MKEVCLKSRAEWRRWLAHNHDKETGIWLVFFKNQPSKQTLDYDAVVEEALCYGWIDSIIKKLDDDRYARKLTPRKLDSRWSDSNKRRVAMLIKNGRMTKFGSGKDRSGETVGPVVEIAQAAHRAGHPQRVSKGIGEKQEGQDILRAVGAVVPKAIHRLDRHCQASGDQSATRQRIDRAFGPRREARNEIGSPTLQHLLKTSPAAPASAAARPTALRATPSAGRSARNSRPPF